MKKNVVEHGKSKSSENVYGVRKKVNGEELSPRSLRKRKRFLKDCTDEELVEIGVK